MMTAPLPAREARALAGWEFHLTARRGRDDDDFFVGEREHPIAVGGDADEFSASAAAGELLHLRSFTWSYFLVGISGLGARNGFFIGRRFRLFGPLFFYCRRRDFRFGSGRSFVARTFRGRPGLGPADFRWGRTSR